MSRRVNSKWLTRKETSIYCIDFSSLGADREGLAAEMQLAQAVVCAQPAASLLLAVDVYHTDMTPELAAFFNQYGRQDGNPIRKMAIIGVSEWNRTWYRWTKKVTWPGNAVFFSDYEKAKDWLVDDRF